MEMESIEHGRWKRKCSSRRGQKALYFKSPYNLTVVGTTTTLDYYLLGEFFRIRTPGVVGASEASPYTLSSEKYPCGERSEPHISFLLEVFPRRAKRAAYKEKTKERRKHSSRILDPLRSILSSLCLILFHGDKHRAIK